MCTCEKQHKKKATKFDSGKGSFRKSATPIGDLIEHAHMSSGSKILWGLGVGIGNSSK